MSKYVCFFHFKIDIIFFIFIIISYINYIKYLYQTEHFFTGFMGDPRGQFQSLENSFIFLKLPLTLNLPGEWGSVSTLFFSVAGLIAPHQILAPESQNICLGV